MTYIYDIFLNFNNELYDFYEWDIKDTILHIKKIPLYKINCLSYNEIYDNVVSFKESLLYEVFNRCEVLENRKTNTIPYAFLITDTYRVLAVLLNSNGQVIKLSQLLLDDEEEIIEASIRVNLSTIEYNIIKERNDINLNTRLENKIKNYIIRDLKDSYLKGNISKLKYLYYEYFNEKCEDILTIYQELSNTLNNEINEKHLNLYNLIKLTCLNKTV